jgi:hypothetical protein
MSKRLSEFLDEPEILVENAIKKLEHISGWESTDVRLLADINNTVRIKMADLGLDPDDTTGPELYHALLVKLGDIENSLNLTPEQLIEKISRAHSGYKVYALKHNVARDLLRSHPPRKLMKQLNYRSVDSMLKRENICSLYSVLFLIESPRWLNVFYKDLAKTTPSDFETQDISIVNTDPKYVIFFDEQPLSTCVALLGAVMVWPNAVSTVALGTYITKSINELRPVSAHIKLRNVEASFGKSLVDIIQNESGDPLKISHLPISWRMIFHHYGQRPVSEHTEFFGPHLLHEDIKAHEIIKSLSSVLPGLSWWQDLEYASVKTEQGVVSLNLLDIVDGQDLPYAQRSLGHGRSSLWHEFISRYLAHPSVEQHFMQQLEPQTVPITDIPAMPTPENDIRQMIEAGV